MSSNAGLRSKLIRNVDGLPKARDLREPLYDGMAARLVRDTAARGRPP